MNKLLLPACIALMSGVTFADDKTQASAEEAANDITQCQIEIEADDQMKFNIDHFVVDTSACKEFTVTLHHVGSLAKEAMGHNIVITTEKDYPNVAVDGMAAGLKNNYIKPDDERVLVSTNIIGGGKTTKATFKTNILEVGGDYEFFCSFPGHYAIMRGKVEVK